MSVCFLGHSTGPVVRVRPEWNGNSRARVSTCDTTQQRLAFGRDRGHSCVACQTRASVLTLSLTPTVQTPNPIWLKTTSGGGGGTGDCCNLIKSPNAGLQWCAWLIKARKWRSVFDYFGLFYFPRVICCPDLSREYGAREGSFDWFLMCRRQLWSLGFTPIYPGDIKWPNGCII